MLHRAFSVFVFRANRSELLLQRRSTKKPLFGGLWTNTCCSHPQEEQDIVQAGQQRLQEECGFTCPLASYVSFVYRAPDPKGNGTEYEYDTILIGDLADDGPELEPDPQEISELCWKPVENVVRDLVRDPRKYAPWFPIALHAILRRTHGN